MGIVLHSVYCIICFCFFSPPEISFHSFHSRDFEACLCCDCRFLAMTQCEKKKNTIRVIRWLGLGSGKDTVSVITMVGVRASVCVRGRGRVGVGVRIEDRVRVRVD